MELSDMKLQGFFSKKGLPDGDNLRIFMGWFFFGAFCGFGGFVFNQV